MRPWAVSDHRGLTATNLNLRARPRGQAKAQLFANRARTADREFLQHIDWILANAFIVAVVDYSSCAAHRLSKPPGPHIDLVHGIVERLLQASLFVPPIESDGKGLRYSSPPIVWQNANAYQPCPTVA